MAFEFILPDIGEGLTEAEIVEWLVEPGQPIALDQPLVRVETDKAVTDIPSPRAGMLLRQGAPAGATVEVGQLLATIAPEGDAVAPILLPGATEPLGPAAIDVAPIVGSLREAEDWPPSPPPTSPKMAAPQALPVVRKLARDLGVDLQTIDGTGAGGRITREDVERAGERSPAAVSQEGDERVRLSKLRRTIAERMERSWREIPHVTTFGEADATRLLEVRRALSDRQGRTLALEALFARAVVPPLQSCPEFNATLDGHDLIHHARVDLGVAVDTPDGLVVAVVRRADELELFALSDEVARLGAAARERRLTPAEVAGATFTISNIGAVGGGYGTPIIPYGTTAILSFGRVREQPVARDGRVEVAPMLPLSLSYDHRVIDGALGRRFLGLVVQNLEEPALFLVEG